MKAPSLPPVPSLAESVQSRTVELMGRAVAVDFPTLQDLPASGRSPDVVVARGLPYLATKGTVIRDESSTGGGLGFRLEEHPEGLLYHVQGVGQFFISSGGDSVRYRLETYADAASVESILIGPVIGMALQLQGAMLLHAGALSTGTSAFAFSGPHGTGKSTLVSSFASVSGLHILTDDILPVAFLGDRVTARQSHGRLKLWEDSATALGLEAARLTPVFPGIAKLRLTVGTDIGTAARREVPLAAFYLLRPTETEDSPVRVSPVERMAAVIGVLGSFYSPFALRTGSRAARVFDMAVTFAQRTPVRSVSYHRSYENLPAIRQAILDDMAELSWLK